MTNKRDGTTPARAVRESDQGAPFLALIPDRRGESPFSQEAAAEVRRIVLENRAGLTDVERADIERRFGSEYQTEQPMTLERVGQVIGVTRDRVSQIQNRAMEKVRLELEAKYLGGSSPPKLEPVRLVFNPALRSFERERR
jgi:DNA-directed RNA polymerase sigma subunit (sigma70/sigma32)